MTDTDQKMTTTSDADSALSRHQLRDNQADGRFEREENGHLCIARYHLEGDNLYIDYVEAPPALRGTGAAGRLMEALVDVAMERKLTLVPICGYAVSWMRRHHEQA
jgi:predicted GNAT family acetyltransferase